MHYRQQKTIPTFSYTPARLSGKVNFYWTVVLTINVHVLSIDHMWAVEAIIGATYLMGHTMQDSCVAMGTTIQKQPVHYIPSSGGLYSVSLSVSTPFPLSVWNGVRHITAELTHIH